MRPQGRVAASSNLALAEALPAPIAPIDQPVLPAATPAAPAHGGRARRATRARGAHDGWTFVMIPPGAGARPRTLRLSVRRLRFMTAVLVTVAGTAVVSGSLLAFLLSMAPAMQPETAGVSLGVFADDSIAFDAVTPAGSESGAVASSLPTRDAATVAAAGTFGERPPAAPARSTAAPRRTTTAARRPIAPPSVSGRRSSSAGDATVAEARAHGLPVIGRITSRFSNARTHPMLGVVRKHNGVDIAAPSGTPITAPHGGRVIFAGRKFGFGNTVEIDHGNGVVTRYAHARTIKVRSGARVEAGATIATVGRTGLASGPHLHFEVLVNGSSVDPLKKSLGSLLGHEEAVAPVSEPMDATPPTGTPDSSVTPPVPATSATDAQAGFAPATPSAGTLR